jgi:hypothetical protein
VSEQLRLLCVLAHPDDESLASVARWRNTRPKESKPISSRPHAASGAGLEVELSSQDLRRLASCARLSCWRRQKSWVCARSVFWTTWMEN